MEKQRVQPETETDFLHTIEQEADDDMHPLLKKILENIKTIALGLLFLVAAVATFSGYKTYQKSAHERSLANLGQVLAVADAKERLTQLEKLQEIPSSLQTSLNLEIARAAMEAKDYEKAASAWKKISVADPTTMTMVGLGEAKSLMLEGNYEKAVEKLSALEKNTGKAYKPLVVGTLAFAAEKAGNTDLAIKNYKELQALAAGQSNPYLEFRLKQLTN